MKTVAACNLGFYLSGGTALSRFYTGHRFSDDLDFFVNGVEDFSKLKTAVFDGLTKGGLMYNFKISMESVIISDSFFRFIVSQGTVELKLDFVNDVDIRFGELVQLSEFGFIDNILNILSNKISAIYRLEPKDFIDIYAICKKTQFDWNTEIRNAKLKEPTVDIFEVSNLFRSFPENLLNKINWIEPVDSRIILNGFNTIAEDIEKGVQNSLFGK